MYRYLISYHNENNVLKLFFQTNDLSVALKSAEKCINKYGNAKVTDTFYKKD